MHELLTADDLLSALRGLLLEVPAVSLRRGVDRHDWRRWGEGRRRRLVDHAAAVAAVGRHGLADVAGGDLLLELLLLLLEELLLLLLLKGWVVDHVDGLLRELLLLERLYEGLLWLHLWLLCLLLLRDFIDL